MKQVTAVALSLVLTAIALAEPQATSTGKTTSAAKKSTNVSAELQQLRHALEAQQQQIQKLSDELNSRDQALQQLQQRLDQSQAAAAQEIGRASCRERVWTAVVGVSVKERRAGRGGCRR